MLSAREPLFLIVADDPQTARSCHLDERGSGVVESTDADARDRPFRRAPILRPASAIVRPQNSCLTDKYACAERTVLQSAESLESPLPKATGAEA